MKSLVLSLAVLPTALAWGNLGHMTVGFVAQQYMSPATIQWAQGILSNTNSSYLASVAAWADSYRYTTAGKFSAPFHYIDAQDNPPSTCNVDYNRDCGTGGCIVSAIQNYTQRVQDGRLTTAHHKEALEFLVHFFGDITQPLHDEAHEVGGNDIPVTFDGVSTNLHHIWDTEMPAKIRSGGSSLSDAQSWATDLAAQINSGTYASQRSSWVSGMTLSDTKGSAIRMAQDANAYVCTYALKGGDAAVESGDLGGAYYSNAAPVVSLQIAKGGYRLAGWLNLIVTGTTGLS